MILETVIFTALPVRRTATDLYLSCFISPRLNGVEGNPARLPLSRYVDFVDGAWAEIVRGMTWKLTLRWSVDDSDEQVLTATRVSADPDRALSRLMFPATMPVDPFAYDNIAALPILSFPAAKLSDALDQVQFTVAREFPETRPRRDQLVTARSKDGPRPPDTRPLDPFNLDALRRQQLDRKIDDMLANGGATKAPATGSPEYVATCVQELNRMLTRPDNASTAAPVWPDLDFHQAFSLLANHPNLLRKLGFIVDLRVDLSAWSKKFGTPRVYVGTSWPGSYDPDKTGVDITTAFPRVLSRLTATEFRPRSTSTFLREDGFVDASRLSPVTSEVEIEVQATQTEATAIGRAQSKQLTSFGTPDRAGIPTRRSTGIAIVQTDYASSLKAIMLRQNAAETALTFGDDILVDAEDVLAGYRVDVRRLGSPTWRTLHRRHGVLTPYSGSNARAPVDLGDDEGWVEPAALGYPDATTSTVSGIRMSETLARWTGWSLSIPPPGKLLDQESKAAAPIGPAQGGAVIDTLHGTVDYSAPAGGALLPALRFSDAQYEFRLRWVDMAGNSVAPDAAGGSTFKAWFQRQDPVASPGVYLAAEPVWGESVEVVVLRTAVEARRNRTTSRRYVAPPSVSGELCLLHGMFDDAAGRPQPGAYATIAARESAALPDTPLARNPGTVPYLPDPLAHHLLVRGIPSSQDVFNVEDTLAFGGAWPAANVLELVLDGALPPGVRKKATGLSMGVPQGRVVRLKLSNGLTAAGLETMDLWRRLSGAAFANAAYAARARAGAMWQLTPDRELVVVHAVQVPLIPPAFVIPRNAAQRWRATRAAGDTAATVAGKVTIDAPSTQSVTFDAKANWFVDNGPGTGLPYIALDQPIGSLGTVNVPDPAAGIGPQDVFASLRAPLTDTRRVQLTASAVATSRFAEYFRESQSFAAVANPVTVNGGAPVVADTAKVTYQTAPKSDPVTASERQYSFDPATGTFTRLTNGLEPKDQIPLGATVTVSYIPDPITQDSSKARTGKTVGLAVPSSARPAAPEVAIVLPAFRWSNSGAGIRTSSTRTGGSLRIYLRRPWGTSGLDEDLGVLLLRASGGGNSDAAKDMVTRWGQDPAMITDRQPPMRMFLTGYPSSQSFTNAAGVVRDVALAETGAPVDVARYAVGRGDATGAVSGYDAERDMWFVDIDIDAEDAYRPMIQLALARYQGVSVPGLELSPITLVDVVQLEPNRSASVSIPAKPGTRADVSLVGPSYRTNEFGAGPGYARVVLEVFRGANAARSASSAAWEQSGAVDLAGVLNNGIATWTGSITIPRVRQQGQYRLAFEQYETILNDGVGTPTARMTAAQLAAARGLRLVHQDIVFLGAASK